MFLLALILFAAFLVILRWDASKARGPVTLEHFYAGEEGFSVDGKAGTLGGPGGSSGHEDHSNRSQSIVMALGGPAFGSAESSSMLSTAMPFVPGVLGREFAFADGTAPSVRQGMVPLGDNTRPF